MKYRGFSPVWMKIVNKLVSKIKQVELSNYILKPKQYFRRALTRLYLGHQCIFRDNGFGFRLRHMSTMLRKSKDQRGQRTILHPDTWNFVERTGRISGMCPWAGLRIVPLTISPSFQMPTKEFVSNKVCSNCEYHIESTLLLQKRVKFAQHIWMQFQDQIQDSQQLEQTPIACDKDLLLNCHQCGSNFDHIGLKAHINEIHGQDHAEDCVFCLILLNSCSFKLEE